MKLVKMSLAAAVLLGASAFAIDNVKVSGDAKVFYATDDAAYVDLNGDGADSLAIEHSGLFDKGSSAADAALRIGVTGDLLKGVSFGATLYAVSTLGLENNLVDNVWSGAHGAQAGNGAGFANVLGGAQVDDQAWLGEAWLAATLGKTTAKLGRMELDTPLAFSEKWSVVPNTFEAAVLINQDIPDTTLVGAWVGKGNGANILSGFGLGFNNTGGAAFGNGLVYDLGVVGEGGDFNTFMNEGAYAFAVVNNSFKPLTAQAWYYDVQNVADAYWLQADIACSLVKGLSFGAQYANMAPKGAVEGILIGLDPANLSINNETQGYALKAGYAMDMFKVSAAYSDVDGDGFLSLANIATGSGQSKLYTEAWWNYGYVGAAGAETYMVAAEVDLKDIVKLGAQYTDASIKATGAIQSTDMQEFTLTASKSFGPLDATVAYIYTDADDQNLDPVTLEGRDYNTIQAYLTLNF